MMNRFLDVGQCSFDHGAISHFLQDNFQGEVDRAHDWSDVETALNNNEYQLILVNRLLDRDHTEGLNIIEKLKATSAFRSIPVMIISNYEDAQQAAIQAGACAGFGKSAIGSEESLDAVRSALG